MLSFGIYCFISTYMCTLLINVSFPYPHLLLESSLNVFHIRCSQPSGLALSIMSLLLPKASPFLSYSKLVPHFFLMMPNFSSMAANNQVGNLPPWQLVYNKNGHHSLLVLFSLLIYCSLCLSAILRKCIQEYLRYCFLVLFEEFTQYRL